MAISILDICPRCKEDISRRLGVITSPSVKCSFCDQQVRVTRNAILNNWQYNGLMWPFFSIWAGMAVLFLYNQELVVELNKLLPIPVDILIVQVIGAVLCFIPAFICALPFALIGRLIGCLVAWRIASATRESILSTTPAPAVQELHSQRWLTKASPEGGVK